VCGAVKLFYRDVVGWWFYKLEMQCNVKYKQKHRMHVRTNALSEVFIMQVCSHGMAYSSVILT
jgi:hypothetical protein